MVEVDRKRTLKKAARVDERVRMRSSMPITIATAVRLLDHLDQRLGAETCKHDLRHATAFCEAESLDQEAIIAWLGQAGGYCDCEALSSLEDLLEEVRKFQA